MTPTDPRPMTETGRDAAKVETREVLGDAYMLNSKARRGRMLSHAVIVNGDRLPVEVLCRRVHIDNLADRYASDPHAPVTCSRCLAALKKRSKP